MKALLSPQTLSWRFRRRREAYRNVFGTPDGELVLADLMDDCGWSRDLFHENPIVMARMIGARRAVLHIKSIIEATDEQLEKFVQAQVRAYEEFPE